MSARIVAFGLGKTRNFRRFWTCSWLRDQFNVQDADDFEKRVLKSDVPVIVDFHATWCGPCKMLAPRLEALVSAKGSGLHLAKVDIDDHADLALEYGVQAVPAVIGFVGGSVKSQFVGLQDDDKIKTFVEKLLKK